MGFSMLGLLLCRLLPSYRASHETGDKRECCLLCRLFCSHRGFLCFKHNERKNTYLARFALHSRRQPLSLQLEGLDHFHPILFLFEQRKCDAKSTMHAREYEILLFSSSFVATGCRRPCPGAGGKESEKEVRREGEWERLGDRLDESKTLFFSLLLRRFFVTKVTR
jgi:hypothetical protein